MCVGNAAQSTAVVSASPFSATLAQVLAMCRNRAAAGSSIGREARLEPLRSAKGCVVEGFQMTRTAAEHGNAVVNRCR